MQYHEYVTLSMILLITTICSAQISFKTIQKDFYKLSGTWEGSLTYLDYSSGKPYTMPANVEIKRIGKTNKFVFSNISSLMCGYAIIINCEYSLW